MCCAAVTASSAAQLSLKAAARKLPSAAGWCLAGVSAVGMAFSVLVAVWVLQTVQLSQLVPFAAAAYVLVPLGGRLLFQEQLPAQFWVGTLLIAMGIVVASLAQS